MQQTDTREIIAGAALLGFGAIMAFNIGSTLDTGTAQSVGPGLLPMVMAIGLCVCGAISILVGIRRMPQEQEAVDWVAALFVSGSIAAFAVLLINFGLLIAVPAQLLISTAFDRRFTLKQRLIFTIVLTLSAYLIFSLGLRVQMSVLTTPW